MSYHEQLNHYLKEYQITVKELAEASGISVSSVSRYRQGKSRPEPEASQKLTEGLLALISAQDIVLTPAQAEEIRLALSVRQAVFSCARFDMLLQTMHIQLKDLAGFVQFMPSYLSKIRTGQRKPADPQRFLDGICSYFQQMHNTNADLQHLRELTGCTGFEDLRQALEQWLVGGSAHQTAGVEDLLRQLDLFDLNDYTTRTHLDALDIPLPQKLPEMHEDYFGIERLRQSHLDFFRLTLQSESIAPIFMHDDMPIEQLAQDSEWVQAWMTAILSCLKKGLTFRVIHNVDRPVSEMFIGLKTWVPLYMTGRIEPYYFPSAAAGVYSHMNFISGAACLSGEGVSGFEADTWYELDTTPDKVRVSQKKALSLLRKAMPLMEIYNAEKAPLYQQSVRERLSEKGELLILHPSLPLHAMPDALLTELLERHQVPPERAERIMKIAAEQQTEFEQYVASDTVNEIIPELTEAQFTVHPLRLSLSDDFYEMPLTYTYQEYCRHLEELRNIRHPRYRLLLREEPVFRNIRIALKRGKWAVFTKAQTPVIHFVIRNPKLLYAVQDYVRDVMNGDV